MRLRHLLIALASVPLCFGALAGDARALDFTFDFTGECDDCAFAGLPTDPGFDPIGDGLTETVSATLTLSGVSVNGAGLIESDGAGTLTFSYGGSSLINPFTMTDPYEFRTALTPTGEVQPGILFAFRSSQNATNPGPPTSFDFPDFCTGLGQQVLDGCLDTGLVSFELESDGSWSVSGTEAFDIGGNGQFTVVPEPGSAVLLGLGLAGIASTRRRSA